MSTLLIKNADILVTMDPSRREIKNGCMYCEDGFIHLVGTINEMPDNADEVFDFSSFVVLPGFVNTHHHFYQTLTRAIPAAQDANLFNWLKTLYPIWAKMTPEDIFISAQTAMAELALSGCTTSSDHLYLFPNGSKLDDEIEAGKEIGIRLHASRGSMSLGESKGGLPPDSVVDTEENILRDSQRLIETYHDPLPGSMLQIVLAPCSPFSVTGDLMRESAKMARHYGVHLHTHLAETQDEEAFCQKKFGYRPVGHMQSVDWVGNDVWFAHSIYVNQDEISVYAHEGCGVAHCPSSNMRLASGIAPIRELMAAGVKTGLGVDGSASNDGSHMLGEARQAFMLSRIRSGLEGFSLSADKVPPLMTGRQALELATLGGASVLGRSDIGSLETGKCADFIAIKQDKLTYAGALHDPVAALIFCSPQNVDFNFVHGQMIVNNGHLVNVETGKLIENHNKAARRLLS